MERGGVFIFPGVFGFRPLSTLTLPPPPSILFLDSVFVVFSLFLI